ncbi:hypothetical protein MMC26_005841 [Xylographa opegraphella]|nr:hypothetical protein [Xylographa opegraphella]
MAVASLALQLVDSVKQLCDFWESVQEAPSRIRGLVDDLKLFAAMLGELQHDEESFGPQKITLLALESCRVKINALHALLQPAGFSSTSKVVRKWTAVKTVLRRDKIERFSSVLEGARSTLVSAQLISLRRLSQRQFQYHTSTRYRSEDLCAVDAVQEHLAGLRMEQSSELVTTTTSAPSIAEHLEDIRCEIRKMAANIANPVIRTGCEQGMNAGLEQTFSRPHQAVPITKHTSARSASRDRGYRKASVVLSRTANMLETFFGSISFHTETTKSLVQENPIKRLAPSEHYEYKTRFRLFPSSWLINMGLDYTINFTFKSNYQGWHQCLDSMRAVRGDSMIFCACGEGDLAFVRRLLSTGEASVRDQNPNGVTPLHIAAYFRQPVVVQYLLEHGADPSALMQTWDNSLLMFGSTKETLAHFFRLDGGIGDPRIAEISYSEARYTKTLTEALSDEHFLFLLDTGIDWLNENESGNAEVVENSYHLIDRSPSVGSIIARCINLSHSRSAKDNVHYLETITSLAMRNPSQLQRWIRLSTSLHVDWYDFLAQEVMGGRLEDDGWTIATLDDLFVQRYICDVAIDTIIHCERCYVPINIGRMVEWEEYVDSIKDGTFIVRKDQTHKIHKTTPTFRKANCGEPGIPRYEVTHNISITKERRKANRARKAILHHKTKRHIDELQFWNCCHWPYPRFRLYRTRELYDIYTETGLCPSCAVVQVDEGMIHRSAEELEFQAFMDADEEPPMLAPF